ncbi:hypothetical protein HDU96_005951 [Phlyctochytrium bullatum]|nr:hypothetical protein HDU96_005951 [Phlyctochytrium bullatum]
MRADAIDQPHFSKEKQLLPLPSPLSTTRAVMHLSTFSIDNPSAMSTPAPAPPTVVGGSHSTGSTNMQLSTLSIESPSAMLTPALSPPPPPITADTGGDDRAQEVEAASMSRASLAGNPELLSSAWALPRLMELRPLPTRLQRLQEQHHPQPSSEPAPASRYAVTQLSTLSTDSASAVLTPASASSVPMELESPSPRRAPQTLQATLPEHQAQEAASSQPKQQFYQQRASKDQPPPPNVPVQPPSQPESPQHPMEMVAGAALRPFQPLLDPEEKLTFASLLLEALRVNAALNLTPTSVRLPWDSIARKLQERHNTKVTGPQAHSKVYQLKKEWRAVKDRKKFFSQEYLRILDDIFLNYATEAARKKEKFKATPGAVPPPAHPPDASDSHRPPDFNESHGPVATDPSPRTSVNPPCSSFAASPTNRANPTPSQHQSGASGSETPPESNDRHRTTANDPSPDPRFPKNAAISTNASKNPAVNVSKPTVDRTSMTLLRCVLAECRKRPGIDPLDPDLPWKEIARRTNDLAGSNLSPSQAISRMAFVQNEWQCMRNDQELEWVYLRQSLFSQTIPVDAAKDPEPVPPPRVDKGKGPALPQSTESEVITTEDDDDDDSVIIISDDDTSVTTSKAKQRRLVSRNENEENDDFKWIRVKENSEAIPPVKNEVSHATHDYFLNMVQRSQEMMEHLLQITEQQQRQATAKGKSKKKAANRLSSLFKKSGANKWKRKKK